jgi:hypothetical protein
LNRIPASIFGGCLLLVGASFDSAGAQAIYRAMGPAAVLPPSEIAGVVRSLNLQPIAPAMLHGDRYAVRVVDRDGYQSVVWVDAQRGVVVSITPSQAMASERTWQERSGPAVAAVPEFDRPQAYPSRGWNGSRYAAREEYARPPRTITVDPPVTVAPSMAPRPSPSSPPPRTAALAPPKVVTGPPPKAVAALPLPDKPPIPRARPELAVNSPASPGDMGHTPAPVVEHSPAPLPTHEGPGQPPPPGAAPVQGFD